VDEGRQVQQELALFRQVAQAVCYPLLETALDMVRAGRPAASDNFAKKIVDGIAALDAAEQAPPSADGEAPSPEAGEPPVMPPPSANGGNGGNPARVGQPPRSNNSPGGAAPTANGANGDGGSPRPGRSHPQPRRLGAAVGGRRGRWPMTRRTYGVNLWLAAARRAARISDPPLTGIGCRVFEKMLFARGLQPL
jgi:hypothetical protein